MDSSGNVYLNDRNNKRILELAAGSMTQKVPPFAGLHAPSAAAVDSTGALYITDAPSQTSGC